MMSEEKRQNTDFLSKCLIKTFKDKEPIEVSTISNNAFLCSSELKKCLSEEEYKQLNQIQDREVWEMAWVMLDDHFQTEY